MSGELQEHCERLLRRAAVGAATKQLDGVTFQCEVCRTLDRGHCLRREAGLDIGNPVALHARHMVVVRPRAACAIVVCAIGERYAVEDTAIHEQIDGAVNGGAPKLRLFTLQLGPQLICREVTSRCRKVS